MSFGGRALFGRSGRHLADLVAKVVEGLHPRDDECLAVIGRQANPELMLQASFASSSDFPFFTGRGRSGVHSLAEVWACAEPSLLLALDCQLLRRRRCCHPLRRRSQGARPPPRVCSGVVFGLDLDNIAALQRTLAAFRCSVILSRFASPHQPIQKLCR